MVSTDTPVQNIVRKWTLFKMSFFGAAHGSGVRAKRGALLKVCHTYPTMMKPGRVIPYLRRIQKMCESRDKPLEFCWHQHFLTWNQQILPYQEIQIKIAFWYIISNSFNFSWVFKDCFNEHGYNFDDVSKNDYKCQQKNLLKMKVFWNKDYNVIISLHDVTNKILSRDSMYLVDVVMWPKFVNSSLSIREVIIT